MNIFNIDQWANGHTNTGPTSAHYAIGADQKHRTGNGSAPNASPSGIPLPPTQQELTGTPRHRFYLQTQGDLCTWLFLAWSRLPKRQTTQI